MSSVVPTTTPLEHILDSSLIKQKNKKNKNTLPKHNSGLTQGIKLIQIPE